MSSPQFVPAFQYDDRRFGWMAGEIVHGSDFTITEIFIPSHQLIINSRGGLFHAENPRNVHLVGIGKAPVVRPLKEIQIPLVTAEKLACIAKLKLEVSAKEKEVLFDLKKYWG